MNELNPHDMTSLKIMCTSYRAHVMAVDPQSSVRRVVGQRRGHLSHRHWEQHVIATFLQGGNGKKKDGNGATANLVGMATKKHPSR